jgi:hypothetical protein
VQDGHAPASWSSARACLSRQNLRTDLPSAPCPRLRPHAPAQSSISNTPPSPVRLYAVDGRMTQPAFMPDATANKQEAAEAPYKIHGWTGEKDNMLLYTLIFLALASTLLKWYARGGGFNNEVPKVNPRFEKLYRLPLGPVRSDRPPRLPPRQPWLTVVCHGS